ncbi:MAG TPA: bifunctional DNA-formamidopyrimidine glycosylase/DNA-(apurinic or apyrimidinic site) lyase [Gemmatimonadaceae bacterium]|nr:bifunctional DNA-formamidopyrimidine glycosylase/DNA-(apurinic or apyrimidinic site) lyase [Gemmatimonadaceae bacterium]
MPELPEVERAARLLDRLVRGRSIERVRVLHPSLARRLPPERATLIEGRTVDRVVRRGKHQLLHLDDGSVVHVHFRMTGDWHVGSRSEPDERFTRLAFDLTGGARLALIDPRALSTVALVADEAAVLPALGLEPLDPTFTAGVLRASLAARRVPIKVALLDQRVVAGLGNIYAAEALWWARIDPRTPARSVGATRLARLVTGIRRVLRRASADDGRYRDGTSAGRFAVYDREGKPCRRCRTRIRRIVQAGRSTYFCPRCQR